MGIGTNYKIYFFCYSHGGCLDQYLRPAIRPLSLVSTFRKGATDQGREDRAVLVRDRYLGRCFPITSGTFRDLLSPSRGFSPLPTTYPSTNRQLRRFFSPYGETTLRGDDYPPVLGRLFSPAVVGARLPRRGFAIIFANAPRDINIISL